MKSVLIHELQPYEDDYKIRVRVCRLWRGKRIKPERNDGFHCVLVDEKGDAIHAIVSEIDYPFVHAKLKQAEVYNISNFFVRISQPDYKVVDNSVQLHFNARTVFVALQNSLPEIPEHRFYLLDYNQLPKRINDNTFLTDIFGCVKAIMPVQEIHTKNGLESKCEINLQNLRRKEIRTTLWGDIAREFDIQTIESLPPPVLLLITSLMVKKYRDNPTLSSTNSTCIFINPQIAQAEFYKAEFCKPTDNVKKLSTAYKQLTAKEVQNAAKTTVHNLNKLNPQNYKEQMVYCRASICRYATHDGWWYEACSHCYRQLKLKENSDLRICSEHGMQVPFPCYRIYVVIEDPNDEATLKLMGKPAEQLFGSCKDLLNKHPYLTQEMIPKEIQQTIGQIHIFQIKINDANDFIIKGIFPDMESFTQQIADEQIPSTPAPSLPDRKRVLDTTRRQLFNIDSDKKSRREADLESTTTSMNITSKQKSD